MRSIGLRHTFQDLRGAVAVVATARQIGLRDDAVQTPVAVGDVDPAKLAAHHPVRCLIQIVARQTCHNLPAHDIGRMRLPRVETLGHYAQHQVTIRNDAKKPGIVETLHHGYGADVCFAQHLCDLVGGLIRRAGVDPLRHYFVAKYFHAAHAMRPPPIHVRRNGERHGQ